MATSPLIREPCSKTSGLELRAWINVGIAALAMVATLPGRTHGLGLITEPLLIDLRLDRVQFGTMNLWATLLGAIFCLPCGWLLDRVGSRLTYGTVVLALGLVVLSMSYVESAIGLVMWIVLTRGLGQSALSVVSLGIIGKSSPRHRGLAMGVFSVLIGLGFALVIQRVQFVERTWGWNWRQIWAGIGGVLLLGVLPIGCLLISEFTSQSLSPGVEENRLDNHDATLSEALASPAFWAFGVTTSVYGLIAAGISLYGQSILDERGFDRETFLHLQSVTFLLGIVFNLTVGWLSQRVAMGRLLGLGQFALAGAMIALAMIKSLSALYAYAVAMALAGGAATVVFFAVWRQMFGKAHLGRIQGVAQMLTVLASAVGPLGFALCKEYTGSYAGLFVTLSILPAVLGLWVWLVPLPCRSTAQAVPANNDAE